ncbi:hypothetical protein LWI29_023755 [Acer saccharum]|uniref:Uncharacterized protein n=1 Tax=Acer saccharum TaxID=4024 RepID=A0AA39RKB6_ACESA|nr:hypothetical protein LWI29_023755 [Acer saccharum]
MSEKLMAHENENTFESSGSKSFSSGFLKPLEDMISSPVFSNFFRRLKLNKEWLNGCKSNLQSLDRILGDAESKAYVNEQVKAWLDELNEVSYDLEDLLNEIVTEELYKLNRVQEIFSAKLGSLKKVKRRLKEITKKIENLRSQGDKLGLHEASRIKREPSQLSVGRDRSEDESQVIGRDDDKKDILKLLLSDADHQTHVITMVGKRGVGKTTLAQLVYNEERVKKQFEFKAWIHDSKDFDDLLLTKAILHAFTYRSDTEDLYSRSYTEDFLDLSSTAITKLPDGVSSLHNLQTMLLSYCSSLTKLPENMENLINLRKLDIRSTSLKEMPADMGCLTNLQDLSDFVVGKDSGSKINELGALSNLQGTLCISHLENVIPAGDAYDAKLKNKKDLEGLILQWSDDRGDSKYDTDVLEHLNPNWNLEKLEITCYGGTRFPNWLGDSSFFKMKFLRLTCSRELRLTCSRELPPLGQLPSLKELEIGPIDGVKKVGQEFYGKNTSSDKPFPSLEILLICEMTEWEEWFSPEVEGEVFPCLKQIRISRCHKLAMCSPLSLLPPSAKVDIDGCDKLLQGLQLRDGKKLQFGSDYKAVYKAFTSNKAKQHYMDGLLKSAVLLPYSYGVQPKHESEIASQSWEHRTDVPTTSHSSPPESSILSTELALPKLPVTVEKQLHEGNSRKEKLLERPSTSRLSEVEEVQLLDSDVVWRTDVSATSNSPPPESSKCLTEDSSAKHVGVTDNYTASTEISSDTGDSINDEGNKAQFRRNEKLLDIPSTSRLQEIEELQLPDSNVVQSADVSVTSNRPLPESSKHKTEDSSVKHGGASDSSSSSSDTDDPTNVRYDEESLEDISSPEQESLNISEISQLKRLPLKLYSLQIEACKALKSLCKELMHSNLRHLYIINCQFLESIQASYLPVPLKTLYIRKCKKLEFRSADETMDKHTSVEHLCIESSCKHTSVEHLCIESSCDPLKSFPLSLFPKLKNLTIWDCVNFNSISITGDHMSLNSLEIRDCTNLESLSEGGLRTTNLTSILLSNCKNLKALPGQLHSLTSLQSLFINECPELDSIPEGGLPSSLNLLRISSCHKLTPGLQWGLHQLNTFSRIEIEGGCRDLESFPEQNLLPMKLNSLQISRFPNLRVLNYKGLQHLTSLQTLNINSCDKLQSLPEEGLPSSLSYLYGFGDLVPTTSLASFKGGCSNLKSFPEEGLLPASLISLQVGELPKLEMLNLKGFQFPTSLKGLHINSCIRLHRLSEKRLPISLSSLSITECSLLSKRCQHNQGEDLPKISHIAYKVINGKVT